MLGNPYLQDFVSTLRTRYPVDGEGMSYSQWISLNTSDPKRPSQPFSFSGYEFQIGIADDMSRQMAVIKPSQVGLTEIQIRKSLAFLVRNRGTSLIFSLPNEKMYKRLSKSRIKPLIGRERAFQSTTPGEKPAQSMDLYEINGSFAYITGMTEGDATSIPADMLCHDELDLSDQILIGLYQSRLQNSSWKLTHKFSTPSFPKYGIDAAYLAGDQKEWMICCQCCGHWQVPLFDTRWVRIPGYRGGEDLTLLDDEALAGADVDGSFIACERCDKELDLLNPRQREWVAKHPGRRISSYRVRPFATTSLTLPYVIDQLLEMKRLDAFKGWRNTVLGEPHTDADNEVTEEACRRVMKSPARPECGKSPQVIGVDMGRSCHIVRGPIINGLVHPAAFEIVPSERIVDRVKEICAEHNIVAGAVDRYPYTPTAHEMCHETHGVVMPTEYRGRAAINLVKDEFGNVHFAQINRTAAIDTAARRVQRNQIEICGYGDLKDIVIAHFIDMVRVEAAEKEASWEKRTGNDHFMHAFVLACVAPRIKDVIGLSHRTEQRTQLIITGIDVSELAPRPLFGSGLVDLFSGIV